MEKRARNREQKILCERSWDLEKKGIQQCVVQAGGVWCAAASRLACGGGSTAAVQCVP